MIKTESAAASGKINLKEKASPFALILIISLFFGWGFIHNLDPVLIPHLKQAFRLTDLETALVDFAVFIAYFLMAVPAGLFVSKFGYKNGILLGLGLFAIGAFLFLPAADTAKYFYFLAALFVIASGLTFLETAANPYITILGDPKNATWRLNLAQSFNGLAAFLAPILGGKFILSEQNKAPIQENPSMAQLHQHLLAEAAKVKGPYLVIGITLILIIILFLFTRLPEVKEPNHFAKANGFRRVLNSQRLRQAIIAQFFYVGAQVCILSFFIRFATSATNLSTAQASWYAGCAGLAFMLGRFAGTFLMKFIQPAKLLIIYGLSCVCLCLLVILFHGILTVYALIAIAFFMSIMFPTIFSIGISDLKTDTQLGSSLIVMSIVGGALLPLGLGYISDLTGNIHTAYFIPLICFAVVVLFGISQKKNRKSRFS
ncbi:L-fucose:H+ symporter permease [Pedobacter aquatilis]|uniref:L-fucose:H+ symporter permease n=1 Tax=Pedobacter aquatilis TaxID=351343 RepID=UPI002930EE9F|nr:L-fucose:H+ symporter permease [Pedobacter aquatilis]